MLEQELFLPVFRSCIRLVAVAVSLAAFQAGAQNSAKDIVRAAVDQWRGVSSRGVITMTVHRPDWKRTLSLRSWTRGNDDSLVRVTKPRRDAGNGTLTIGNEMWTYSPKVNRVIRIPSSMMNQNWMGSDFSNRDISRADDIVDHYQHTLLETVRTDGREVHVIRSIPNEEAAVVWGHEILMVRDDGVLLEHAFFDQDGILVKSMVSLEIGERGGRTIATRQRMAKADAEGEWTEIHVDEMEFDLKLGDILFTLSNLQNPRE